MKGNEGTPAICTRKNGTFADHHVVRRPVRRIEGYGVRLAGALILFLPVAAIFRGKNELLLEAVIIALRPAIVLSLLDAHHLLRREIGTLFSRKNRLPGLKHVAAMLDRYN